MTGEKKEEEEKEEEEGGGRGEGERKGKRGEKSPLPLEKLSPLIKKVQCSSEITHRDVTCGFLIFYCEFRH